jgi:hypothetical protein
VSFRNTSTLLILGVCILLRVLDQVMGFYNLNLGCLHPVAYIRSGDGFFYNLNLGCLHAVASGRSGDGGLIILILGVCILLRV